MRPLSVYVDCRLHAMPRGQVLFYSELISTTRRSVAGRRRHAVLRCSLRVALRYSTVVRNNCLRLTQVAVHAKLQRMSVVQSARIASTLPLWAHCVCVLSACQKNLPYRPTLCNEFYSDRRSILLGFGDIRVCHTDRRTGNADHYVIAALSLWRASYSALTLTHFNQFS